VPINLKSLFDACRRRLVPRWGEGEALQMSRLLLTEVLGVGFGAVLAGKTAEASPVQMDRLEQSLMRLEEGEPLQYVLGRVHFMDLELRADRRALIPRPETEELCRLIVQENPQPGLRVLDIGTGSGCIAVSLARHLRRPEVWALDAYRDALALAEENARSAGVQVRFMHSDILNSPLPAGTWDLIVSNPPYVPEGEKSDMENHVLDHEPHGALFVPDGDPLRFYRRIAALAAGGLAEGGRLYFEIHERRGDDLRALLGAMGYADIRILPDLHGKSRMASATFTAPIK
jgi:release factor glutamine methyltransferase